MSAQKSPSLDRQKWLETALTAFRSLFEEHGHIVPDHVRVSVGFPYRGKKDTIGQCWDSIASSDKHFEIFITPKLAADDSARILDVLAHELCHAVAGSKAAHGPKFKAVAISVGLQGKMTCTTAGEELGAWCAAFVKKHGPCPSGRLNPLDRVGKQGTRLIKCECETCGYVVRTTKKWLDEAGAPHCGVKSHGRMTADDGEKEED